MPPWPPRSQPHTSNGIASNTNSSHIDTNRPLPPLPPTSLDLDIPTLYPYRRADAEATPAKHGRSFSHPFPFFGGGGKRSDKRNVSRNKINLDATDGDESIGDGRSNRSSNVPSRNPSGNAGSEPMTGRCIACDSVVRWPRDLKVFRCTICLTINDLEPNQETCQHPLGTTQNKTHALLAIPRKGTYRFETVTVVRG